MLFFHDWRLGGDESRVSVSNSRKSTSILSINFPAACSYSSVDCGCRRVGLAGFGGPTGIAGISGQTGGNGGNGAQGSQGPSGGDGDGDGDETGGSLTGALLTFPRAHRNGVVILFSAHVSSRLAFALGKNEVFGLSRRMIIEF